MKRIGMLTSGGDCQALNATMRGVAKGLENLFGIGEVEIYGFLDGYKGLIYGNYQKMKPMDFTGLLNKGGTILGTSRMPFKMMGTPTDDGVEKVPAMIKNYKKLNLDCLVVLGGNGSQKTANLLSENGLNVVGLPKTIDNDIWGTDITFGFQSAVDVATHAIDCIYTTAESHSRVFVIEIMGHKVGWITLYAGIAGGADVILLPEVPYDINKVYKAIDKRTKQGKRFTIICVAEGAIPKDIAKLPKRRRRKPSLHCSILQLDMRSQTRSVRSSAQMSAWQFPAIPREAEVRMHMTALSPAVSVQRLQSSSGIRTLVSL